MADAFTIKVFFRGDWCPWCNGYLRDFNGHLDTIRGLGGSVVGITSQVGNQAKENNGLDFDIQVDAENVEAKKYDIFITPKAETPLAEVDGMNEHGMVQPGVVVEDADGKVLYRWAIVPSEMNFGGATDRPLVADIVARWSTSSLTVPHPAISAPPTRPIWNKATPTSTKWSWITSQASSDPTRRYLVVRTQFAKENASASPVRPSRLSVFDLYRP